MTQNNETVFVTGKGAKDKMWLIWGLVSIAGFLILVGIAGAGGGTVVGLPGGIVFGIVFLVNYFRFQHAYIQVTNLRVLGKGTNGNADIPLNRIKNISRGFGSAITIKYIAPNGALKRAIFPKMENTEQIFNAIYSLTTAPPPQ